MILALILLCAGPQLDGLDGLAPANRWPTQGGGTARSGASHTEPLRRPVELAWRHEAGGEIQGEPLVWDDRVLIEIARGGSARALRVLDLLTGTPVLPDLSVSAELPLEPSIWQDTVVYRAGRERLVAVRLDGDRFHPIWNFTGEGEVGAPLLVGSSVYAGVGNSLQRVQVGRRRPDWRLEGRFRGRVSLLGEHAYAVDYGSAGQAYLRRVDRETGAAQAEYFAGHHGGLVPGQDSMVSVHAMSAGLFVHFERAIDAFEGREVHLIGLEGGGSSPRTLEPLPASVELLAAPAAWNTSWLGTLVDGEGLRTLVLKENPDDLQLRVLATRESNGDFALGGTPVSTAGGVGLVGARAFDLSSFRVLWRLPIESSSRAVLARDTVLLVEGGTRLVAVRGAVGRGGARTELEAPRLVKVGRVVLRDGSVEVGPIGVDVRAGHLGSLEGKEAPWRMQDVLMLEEADGPILLGTDVVRGIQALTEHDLAETYTSLAKQSMATNEVGLIGAMVDAARAHGAPEADLEVVVNRIETLRRRPEVVRSTRAEELRAQAAGLASRHVEALWSRASKIEADAREPWLTELLRATLALEPGHARAWERVRELLPESLRPPAGTGLAERLDWLTFAEATAREPIRIVELPERKRTRMTASQRLLEAARASWRDDLIGLESEHLLILTPVRQPGAVASCLAMGELVCDALEEIFTDGSVERDTRQPLVLHLYESKEEYLEHGTQGSEEGGSGLGWSAGHYDQYENVSRIFLPEDSGGFDQVMETYAHELTHHWLRMQCPMFPFEPLEALDATQPGYWVVEGFACVLDEFRFDLRRGTWHPQNSQSRRIDLVANAAAGQGIPWDSLYRMSHEDFTEMALTVESAIPSTTYLGIKHVVSARHMFYAQAAATARYLFEGEDARRRPQLLAYLTAWYTNDQDGLDVQAAFGLDADELGREVAEWARGSVELGAGTGR